MATVKEIAEKAKVSESTAQYVLGGKSRQYRIGPAVVQRVEAAAEELGYEPAEVSAPPEPPPAAIAEDTAPRHPRRTSVIGLPMALRNPNRNRVQLWLGMLLGVEQYARRAGCDLRLITGKDDADSAARALACYHDKRVDALIMPAPMRSHVNSDPDSRNARIVYLTTEALSGHPRVGLDPNPGIKAAVSHLRELGHRRLLYVTDYPAGRTDPQGRVLAVLAEADQLMCDTLGLHTTKSRTPVAVGEYIDWCRRRFARRAPAGPPPSAIVCCSDLAAIGVRAALQEAGHRVPEDVSLVGFGDTYARLCVPTLTVVTHRLGKAGRRACELALRMVGSSKEFNALRSHLERVPAKLIEGASTAQAP